MAGDEVEIELNQQLHVDEGLMDKLVDTLTQQVYCEKEIAAAIGNLTADGDRVMERIDTLEEKHDQDRQRSLRMDGHHFALMEDVDRLEDIMEAVVPGAVNTQHAAFLTSKAGLSCVLI
jgi:hypothetical protein